jgi:uncharacterized protein YqhQ
VIRGVFGFVDSMVIGYKALMRSADIYCEEPDAPEQESEVAEENAASKSSLGAGVTTAVMLLATVLGIVLAVGLFVWLPTFLYNLIAGVTPGDWGLAENRVLRSVFEGVLKVIVLIVYMALVSLMKDIRRTFMYHGAEHKTIFCYEHSMPLTVENVRGERRFHPRCGTSFLILMLLVSIAIGLFIPAQFGTLEGWTNTLVRAGIKILLIPLTMGIGYELLKIAGKHDNIVTRIISAPGMWLQRITVREPTDDMIECAIKAFIAVLPEEEKETEALRAAEAAE